MLRSLIESATRRLRFRRRLPDEFANASLVVSPSCGLKFLFKPMRNIDPILLSLAREFVQEGHVVWDVGANVGLFAFTSAQRCGKGGAIIAIEADTWLVQLLRESARLQSDTSAPVSIIPAAVAGVVDLRTFHIAHRSRAANFLEGYGSTQTGGTEERQIVIAISLDWLAERCPLPDVLKIDVEGAELEVLRGAAKLLATKRPVILCEVGSATSRGVSSLLHEFGYRFYDGESSAAVRPEVDLATWNCIALPMRPTTAE